MPYDLSPVAHAVDRAEAEADLALERLFALIPGEQRLRYLAVRQHREWTRMNQTPVAGGVRPPVGGGGVGVPPPAGLRLLDQTIEAEAADENKKSLRLLDIMRQTPNLDFKGMAEGLYGDTSPNSIARLRSLLQNLKNRGFVINPSRGVWQLRATPQEEARMLR